MIVLKGCKMNKLKTLKDMKIGYAVCKNKWGAPAVRLDELRYEAVKWIKSEELQCSDGDHHTKEWITHFFNITDEDLKEEDTPRTLSDNILYADECDGRIRVPIIKEFIKKIMKFNKNPHSQKEYEDKIKEEAGEKLI